MNRFSIVILLFYAIAAGTIKAEDTTETAADVLDPYGSDETYDPQRDYSDFKSSYEKLYKLSGLPSIQQKSWQPYQSPIDDVDVEGDTVDTDIDTMAEQSTNLSDIGKDSSDIPTTIQPQIEQQTTIKSNTENAAMRSINDFVKGTQRSIPIAAYEQTAPNAELLMANSALTSDPFNPIKNEDDLVNETSNAEAQHASVAFIQNLANIHNESTDYVMDEANNSQSITSIPNSMDTTITSQPSSPVSFISTRPPNKFEAQPRVYKYNAHEIVRKYFEDIFIRTPLAVLINTAPEPLRKAKLLWTSVLRQNSSIDIVLVAFNSSGKRISNGINVYLAYGMKLF